MSERGNNEIIYEEGWRTSAPADPERDEEGASPGTVPGDERSKPLLISIQLILCAVAALVLFLLKAMDSPAYHGMMTWYRTQMNRPVIAQEFFEGFRARTAASTDEITVKASPDELPPR